MPKFSLVVPVYNVEEYIEDCVASILAQTFQDYEVIIVDDCSPDRSIEKAKKIVGHDPRFRFLRHEQNKGLSASRNTGIAAGVGDFICFIDSDDVITSDYLQSLSRVTDSGADIIGFCGSVINANGDSMTGYPTYLHNILTFNTRKGLSFGTRHTAKEVFRKSRNIIRHTYSWLWCINREFLIRRKVRFVEGILWEDVVFFASVFAQLPRIVLIPDQLYLYRQRPNSITHEEQLQDHAFDVIDEIKSLQQKDGHSRVQRTFLRNMLTREYFAAYSTKNLITRALLSLIKGKSINFFLRQDLLHGIRILRDEKREKAAG